MSDAPSSREQGQCSWGDLPRELVFMVAMMLDPGDYSHLASVDQQTRFFLTHEEVLASYDASLSGRSRVVRFVNLSEPSITLWFCPLFFDYYAWRAFAGDEIHYKHVAKHMFGKETVNAGVCAALLRDNRYHPNGDETDMFFLSTLVHLPIAHIVRLIRRNISLSENVPFMHAIVSGISTQNARELVNTPDFFDMSADNAAMFLALRRPQEYSTILAAPSRLVSFIRGFSPYFTAISQTVPFEYISALLDCITPSHYEYKILAPAAPSDLFVRVASRALTPQLWTPTSFFNHVVGVAIEHRRTDAIEALLDARLVYCPSNDPFARLIHYARFPGREKLAARLELYIKHHPN